jgi:hypothetical protein
MLAREPIALLHRQVAERSTSAAEAVTTCHLADVLVVESRQQREAAVVAGPRIEGWGLSVAFTG